MGGEEDKEEQDPGGCSVQPSGSSLPWSDTATNNAVWASLIVDKDGSLL